MRASIMLLAFLLSTSALAAGDAQRGARVFQACAACHSLEPGRNLTGPSLSGILGRKAASLESFARYSSALKKSGIVWNEKTLDAWTKDPETMAPGNYMSFGGIKDDRARADLIAFLEKASQAGSPLVGRSRGLPSLKEAPPDNRVSAIRHCKDSYFVTTAAGQTLPYWEFNLRFKTDSSASGPAANAPVMVGQGMQGDRAQVVFFTPAEISAFIKEGC